MTLGRKPRTIEHMKNKYTELLAKTNVVGVIACDGDINTEFVFPKLPLLPQIQPPIDIFEIRLDKITQLNPKIGSMSSLISTGKPLIITPRDASEGGCREDWNIKDRVDLFFKFMPYATFIDVEASTAEHLGLVIEDAHRTGIGVIVSYHNFDETPSYAEIIRQAETCRRFGGDVLKIAVRVHSLGDLVELNDAVSTICGGMKNKFPFKVSAMAVGKPFGKISRFLDAITGGPFVYGSLSGEGIPGQPKAVDVKRILAELR